MLLGKWATDGYGGLHLTFAYQSQKARSIRLGLRTFFSGEAPCNRSKSVSEPITILGSYHDNMLMATSYLSLNSLQWEISLRKSSWR